MKKCHAQQCCNFQKLQQFSEICRICSALFTVKVKGCKGIFKTFQDQFIWHVPRSSNFNYVQLLCTRDIRDLSQHCLDLWRLRSVTLLKMHIFTPQGGSKWHQTFQDLAASQLYLHALAGYRGLLPLIFTSLCWSRAMQRYETSIAIATDGAIAACVSMGCRA